MSNSCSHARILRFTAQKAAGAACGCLFTRAMQNSSEQRHRLGMELRQALASGQFELWYQPQVSLPDAGLSGVGALLRWRHPDHGLLAPQTFLAVLEKSAIAEEVGDWIVEQACAAAAGWKRAGLGSLCGWGSTCSRLSFGRAACSLSSAIVRHDLRASQFEIEITENTVLRHSNQSTKILRKLRSLGVVIAFDDFGTGFASLSLLQQYPLTRLKIDRSFIARIDRKVEDAAIVKAVIAMAKSLGLAVIAEGVETAEQEAALVKLGCGEAQGYRYRRAMPTYEIAETYLRGSSVRRALKPAND